MDFLPQREFLPCIWPPQLLDLAAGTGLDTQKARLDRLAMEEDYIDHIVPAMQRHPERFKVDNMTLELFCAAASWVSSRAFFVDSTHGMDYFRFETKNRCDVCTKAL